MVVAKNLITVANRLAIYPEGSARTSASLPIPGIKTGTSAFALITPAYHPEADVAAVGRESPKLTHSGSGRFVLTNLKCKSEIRIVPRDLLTFEGREVRSGDALSFPRNIG